MVWVPAGTYLLGRRVRADDRARGVRTAAYASPARAVDVPVGFWLYRTEVTNAQYRRFVDDTGHPAPRCTDGFAPWDDPTWGVDDRPAVCVDWHDAVAYARWAGGALPSEDQWEAAARGPDGRPYPWGASPPTPSRARYAARDAGAARVGRHPDGAGPFGTADQAGNVWEWCGNPWTATDYAGRDTADVLAARLGGLGTPLRALRGGAWPNPPVYLQVAYRKRVHANTRGRHVGFRVMLPSGAAPAAISP
ncbi:MAG: formylglycine-generating enzyme family protein [Acidobacteriota bacterium]